MPRAQLASNSETETTVHFFYVLSPLGMRRFMYYVSSGTRCLLSLSATRPGANTIHLFPGLGPFQKPQLPCSMREPHASARTSPFSRLCHGPLVGHGGAGAQQGKQGWAAAVGHRGARCRRLEEDEPEDDGGRAGEYDTLRSGRSTNSDAN